MRFFLVLLIELYRSFSSFCYPSRCKLSSTKALGNMAFHYFAAAIAVSRANDTRPARFEQLLTLRDTGQARNA
jgi:hypothetical protein